MAQSNCWVDFRDEAVEDSISLLGEEDTIGERMQKQNNVLGIAFIFLSNFSLESIAWTSHHNIQRCKHSKHGGVKRLQLFGEKQDEVRHNIESSIGACIAASALAFGLTSPAFAIDTPMVSLNTKQSYEKVLSSRNEGYSVGGNIFTLLSYDDEESFAENLEAPRVEQKSENNHEEDKIVESSSDILPAEIVVKADSVTVSSSEEDATAAPPSPSLDDTEPSHVASTNGNSDQLSSDETSTNGLDSVTAIAKETSEVVKELEDGRSDDAKVALASKVDARDDTLPSEEIIESTTPAESPINEESDMSGQESKLSKILASAPRDGRESSPATADDFVGEDERELEEEEFVHHELSEAQIEWLRKH